VQSKPRRVVVQKKREKVEEVYVYVQSKPRRVVVQKKREKVEEVCM